MGWAMTLIGLYILFVGPVNYRFLKRRRRLDQAWLTIPAITLIATAIMYSIGYRMHGNDLRIYDLAVVRAVPEAGVAHVTSYTGLFSPGSRSYDLEAADVQFFPVQGSYGSQMREFDIHVGRQQEVHGLQIDQWSFGGVASEAVIDWPEVEVQGLEREGKMVTGELLNPFDVPLERAMIMVPGNSGTVPNISRKKGQPINLHYSPGIDIGISGSDLSSDENDRAIRRHVLGAAWNADASGSRRMSYSYGGDYVNIPPSLRPDAVLAGWISQSPLDIKVNQSGRREGHYLAYAHLPIKLKSTGGSGIVPGSLVERSPSSVQAGCDSNSFVIQAAQPATIQFDIGKAQLARRQAILLLSGPELGQLGLTASDWALDTRPPFTVAVWSDEDQEWLRFAPISPNQSIKIPVLPRWEEGGSSIQLRLEYAFAPNMDDGSGQMSTSPEERSGDLPTPTPSPLSGPSGSGMKIDPALAEFISKTESACWEARLSIDFAEEGQE